MCGDTHHQSKIRRSCFKLGVRAHDRLQWLEPSVVLNRSRTSNSWSERCIATLLRSGERRTAVTTSAEFILWQRIQGQFGWSDTEWLRTRRTELLPVHCGRRYHHRGHRGQLSPPHLVRAQTTGAGHSVWWLTTWTWQPERPHAFLAQSNTHVGSAVNKDPAARWDGYGVGDAGHGPPGAS